MTDFLSVLRLLSDADVAYVVVGGVASIVHGSSRLTQDIDVVYERSDANIERLVRALADQHPYLRGAPPGLPFRWDTRTVKAGLNFTLTTDAGALDLLGHVAGGPDYEAIAQDAITVDLEHLSFRCVDLEQLIALKKAAGRPKDLETIAELEALREAQDDA